MKCQTSEYDIMGVSNPPPTKKKKKKKKNVPGSLNSLEIEIIITCHSLWVKYNATQDRDQKNLGLRIIIATFQTHNVLSKPVCKDADKWRLLNNIREDIPSICTINPYTIFSNVQSKKRNIQVTCSTSIMPVELIVWDTEVCKNTW